MYVGITYKINSTDLKPKIFRSLFNFTNFDAIFLVVTYLQFSLETKKGVEYIYSV